MSVVDERGRPTARDALWHGGAPGRRPGDRLLPPAVTGLRRTSSQLSLTAGLGDIAYRSDRVYLSTDRELARVWAGQWTNGDGRVGYGWLYRVEADVDLLEPDEDLLSLPGLSYQTPTATVSSVYARAVAPDQPMFERKLRRVLNDLKRARDSAG